VGEIIAAECGFFPGELRDTDLAAGMPARRQGDFEMRAEFVVHEPPRGSGDLGRSFTGRQQ